MMALFQCLFQRLRPGGVGSVAGVVPGGLRVVAGSAWVAVFLLVPSCKKQDAATPSGPPILARVGAEVITVAEFEEEVARRRAQHRPVRSKEEVLEEMIAHRTLVQRALHAGLDQDPEVVRAYHSLLIGTLRERSLEEQLRAMEVGEDEILACYQEELGSLTTPAKVKLALLFLPTDSRMGEEKVDARRQRLREAREAARLLPAGERGFGSLAITSSEDQTSRYKGGDIGWVDVGRSDYRWPAEVLEAGAALANPRDVSDLIETGSGIYLVMKLDSRPEEVAPLEAARSRIAARLRSEKREALEARFREESRTLAGVETYPATLSAVEVPSDPATDPGQASQEPSPPALPR